MRKLLHLLIMFLIALSFYRLIDSFLRWHEVKRIQKEYVDKIGQLKLERDSLKARVEALKTDKFLQEELARKIGYAKPGEKVYIIDEGKE